MYSITQLGHREVQSILTAVAERAQENNQAVAVSVVDEHGEVQGFLRMDGVGYASVTIAQNKAVTAARDRQEPQSLGDASKAYGFPVSHYTDPRFTGFGGGVPVFYQDKCVGGVGISGLTEEEDAELAKFGIAQAIG